MSSGAWLPAEQVVNLSSMSLRAMIADVEIEREKVIAEATYLEWSWRRFRYIEVPMPRETAEASTYVTLLDCVLENPFLNKQYVALNRLCATAINAEQMVPGGQVFVSTKDFSMIAPFIDGKERYDATHPDLPDPGDHAD